MPSCTLTIGGPAERTASASSAAAPGLLQNPVAKEVKR